MDADQEALARFLGGDERGFEELVVRYEARVRNLAQSVVRDRALAEDVAQETFLTAYRKAALYRSDGSFRSWLYRIAVNRARDELRRQSRRGEVDLGDDALSGSNEPHRGLEVGWDLTRALSRMRPEHRLALTLREVEGLSYREIAASLDWPMGTVETRIHRARLELRRLLEQETKDDVRSRA